MNHLLVHVNQHIKSKAREVKYISFILQNDIRMSLYVISVLFCYAFVYVCLLIGALWSPAGKVLISWLSFVMSYYEVVTFPLVFWTRCGA